MKDEEKLANFLFEIGSLRKINRSHRQTLLTNDDSDNIASHSYRVAVISIFLAQMEQVDVGRVVLMALSHDWPETRSGDHNWVHKRHVAINTLEIIQAQAQTYSFPSLTTTIEEYEKRQSRESMVAKDADTLDQLLLLKEYEWQGNKEATLWLTGKSKKRPYAWLERLHLESSKQLGRSIYDTNPSDWWKNIYTTTSLSFDKPIDTDEQSPI